MRLDRFVLLFSMGLLAGGVFAASAQEQESQQPPRFRAEVFRVLVDVLVLDQQGNPVQGLTREDFEIYEDGVRQEIASFDIIDWTSYVGREAPAGETSPPDLAEGHVNVFPRRFIFIINRQGADFAYMVRAKRALESFVVESMAEGDEAMIIDIGNSTRVIQNFQDSKEQTLQSLRSLRPMRVDLFAQSEFATRNVYQALEGLGEALRDVPGRKVVVFFSPELRTTSLPGSRESDLTSYLEDTIEALNQSNATVYAIDLRGIEAPFGERFGGGLFSLANETGGRLFENLSTFEPAAERIGRENRRYYLLTYTPSELDLDGSFREIEVRVNRPDAEVIARKGYFARQGDFPLAAEKEEPARPSGDVPAPAKTAGPDLPAAVEVTTYLLPGEGGTVDVPISVALPTTLLRSEDESAPRTLTLTVTDAAGKEVQRFEDQVDLESYYVVRKASLAPGAYLLQLQVDANGKELYRASSPIDVPSGYGDRFGISSIIPVLPPEGSSAPASGEPLPLRPSPSLSRGEDAYLFFRVFPGRGGKIGNEIQLSYGIFQGEREIAAMESREPLRMNESAEAGAPILLRMPMKDLPPGLYRVEIRVFDPESRRRAAGEIELVVR